MQVRRKLDHTEVRLRLTRDWRDPIRFVGQFIGALGLLLLLGWPLVGVGVIVLGALLYAGMTRWQHLLHGLLPDWVVLRVRAAHVEVELGRKRLSIVPIGEEIRIHHDLKTAQRTLHLTPTDARPKAFKIQLSLEEEKLLWQLIDTATKSARGRSGLGERDIPRQLQQTLKQ